ncbi:MAG: DUF3806 domain-containing protein [Halieaceae bacterium]|jgi:hypothetical protein|nr:DUF3806 domain-containing protein [Halieaceae bacterium]
MSFIKSVHCLFIAAAVLVATASGADNTVRVGELSQLDLQYMTQQRDLLNDMAALELGRGFTGDRDNDLQLLQLMLDRRLVRPDQTRELQAMGVILGDLLAADLDMHWVVYEDAHGRSRALRYRESDEYLFPITMISRRQEAENDTPVAVIYQKAYDIIAPLRPALPFR